MSRACIRRVQFVINSDILPQKVGADLRAGKGDVRLKTSGVLAEVFAVLHLSKLGYKNFNDVLPSDRSRPGFMAEFAGTPARVEVKNLAEPEDWITKVAMSRWEERSREQPTKYRFRAVLKHKSRGSVSEVAIKRLRCIVDQLPTFRKPFEEVLDGVIRIRFDKFDLSDEPEGFLEQKMYEQYRAKPHVSGYISVITGIGPNNLQFNLGEFQALFLKALRVIAAATPKFFAKGVDRVSHNVIALHWEVPDSLVDSDVPDITGPYREIKARFDNRHKYRIPAKHFRKNARTMVKTLRFSARRSIHHLPHDSPEFCVQNSTESTSCTGNLALTNTNPNNLPVVQRRWS